MVLGATLLMALPVAALAQTSRVEGMAIQGDYIKDYTAIYGYPSQIGNVGNLIYGELGVATGGVPVDRSVGTVMGDWWEGRFGTFGVHLRQVTPQFAQGDTTSSPNPGNFGLDPNANIHEQFDLMWGRKMGTANFGLRFHRSNAEVEIGNNFLGLGNISNLKFDFTQAGSPNLARNIMGLGVGFGWEMSPSTNVELAGHFQSRTFEISDTNGVTIAEADGKSTYQLLARAWWQWQPNVMVVPVFKWYSYDLSTAAGATIASNHQNGWQLGAAGNWTIGSNDLFVLGATFAQNKIDHEADIFGFGFANGEVTESFTPQVFAALETHVNSWLTLRFGGNKGAWHSTEITSNSTPGTVTIRDSPFAMSLGAGVKVGGLQLDAVMNDTFPHNGLYFVSGSSTSPLFSKVTATYSF